MTITDARIRVEDIRAIAKSDDEGAHVCEKQIALDGNGS